MKLTYLNSFREYTSNAFFKFRMQNCIIVYTDYLQNSEHLCTRTVPSAPKVRSSLPPSHFTLGINYHAAPFCSSTHNICEHTGRISTSNVLRIFNTNKGSLLLGGGGGGEREKSLNVNPSLAKSKPSNQAMRGRVGGREKSGIKMLTPIKNKMLK